MPAEEKEDYYFLIIINLLYNKNNTFFGFFIIIFFFIILLLTVLLITAVPLSALFFISSNIDGYLLSTTFKYFCLYPKDLNPKVLSAIHFLIITSPSILLTLISITYMTNSFNCLGFNIIGNLL